MNVFIKFPRKSYYSCLSASERQFKSYLRVERKRTFCFPKNGGRIPVLSRVQIKLKELQRTETSEDLISCVVLIGWCKEVSNMGNLGVEMEMISAAPEKRSSHKQILLCS